MVKPYSSQFKLEAVKRTLASSASAARVQLNAEYRLRVLFLWYGFRSHYYNIIL